jgi:hypothetical protein
VLPFGAFRVIDDTANQALSYVGLAYTWRQVIAAAEIEKGDKVSYAFRLGTRF